MAKLKKTSVKRMVCPTCRGNGFIKLVHEDKAAGEYEVHQCWDCDSEGEFYIHEPQDIQPDDYVDPFTGDVVKLN